MNTNKDYTRADEFIRDIKMNDKYSHDEEYISLVGLAVQEMLHMNDKYSHDEDKSSTADCVRTVFNMIDQYQDDNPLADREQVIGWVIDILKDDLYGEGEAGGDPALSPTDELEIKATDLMYPNYTGGDKKDLICLLLWGDSYKDREYAHIKLGGKWE